MRILHVIDSDGLYGAEMMLLNLMEEQRRLNLNPVLLSIADFDKGDTSLEDEAKKRLVDVIPFRMKRGYSLRSAREIVHRAHASHITVIHSHGYKGDILIGSLPRHVRDMPMIRTQHGRTSTSKLSKIWFYEILDKLVLRNVEAIVHVNGFNAQPAGGTSHGTGHQYVVENGIPELTFDPVSAYASDPEVREFCSGGFIIGTICRLSEEKGLVYLISALSQLFAYNNNFKTVIIGEGPQKDLLLAMARDAGLSRNILITGYRKFAYHYLPKFDVFVIPSLTEGLPITLLEAMQAQVPVVASRVGGIPAVLEQGQTGILIEPKDPASLATAIRQVWSDPAAAEGMARKAREVALTRYSSRRMAEDYMRVYESVVRNWRQ